ncbi:MAG: hypothetical protein AAB131_04360, partial [Actinomycetota bacterium]
SAPAAALVAGEAVAGEPVPGEVLLVDVHPPTVVATSAANAAALAVIANRARFSGGVRARVRR